MSPDHTLEPVAFADLKGWDDDTVEDAWPAFLTSARSLVVDEAPLRRARPASDALRRIAAHALADASTADPRAFFATHFQPWRIGPPAGHGFVTAYYEPCVEASLVRTSAFAAPILCAPEPTPAGRQEPLPDRLGIRHGALALRSRPVVWLRDEVEVFMVQVQGSARATLPDGQTVRLVYAGRNGHPYTSIGRLLIERGAIAPDAMSLATLKGWLRENGAGAGGPADAVMDANASYVFFRAEPIEDLSQGPIGGQGVPLSPDRSLAVDRAIWSYGLPVWVDAPLLPTPFRKLAIAQDTGSAIVGPARADLFFGSGDEAGARAGAVRHAADLTMLLPRDAAP